MIEDSVPLPSETPEWRRVAALAGSIRTGLDAGADTRIGPTPVISACGLEVHGERVRSSGAALEALHALARARRIEARRDAMFAGSIVNPSERRAALHIALRSREPSRSGVAGTGSIGPTRERMKALSGQLHAGLLRGSSGEPIREIVNIGIGGSDFGSRLLCDALSDLAPAGLKVHFVSGVDALQIERLCRTWSPERTVFIVSSKSFSTVETRLNATTLLERFKALGLGVERQWFAVTGKADAAEAIGIPRANVFDVPDFVGGRFSAWGAVGLPAALYLGWPVYEQWLAGGAEMDEHHLAAPIEENLPVRLALHNVWHSTFLGCPSHCIASYDNRLANFLTWAQQLEMESNGKSISEDGRRVDYPTAPIVWGGLGNDGQHTYYQLLREGTRDNAVTLITVEDASTSEPRHAENLSRQAEAQTEALARRDGARGFNSVTRLRLRDLSPRSLGALMSAFEHATTVSAWIWGINPFDQPGVELGKKLAAQAQPR